MLGVLVTVARADFTINQAGPIASVGALGDPDNGVFTSTYTGPSAIFSTLSFTGDLTEVQADTFANEARWRITNTALGAAVNYTPTGTGDFTGTITVSSLVPSLLVWGNNSTTFQFEARESFDDGPGADSTWSNIKFNFGNAVTTTFIGTYTLGTALTFDTLASDFNTNIALYSSTGALIGQNDDASFGTIQSQLTATGLAAGDYYLAQTTPGGFFQDGFARAGISYTGGHYDIKINGASVASGTQVGSSFNVIRLTVAAAPEPGTLALLMLGGSLVIVRRRLWKVQ